MSNISPTITFARGATTITLPSPRPGQSAFREREQNISKSGAGDDYIYDKGVSTCRLSMTLEITLAQKADLDSFFNTTCQGGVNTFTYTDNKAVSHTSCRFLQPALEYTKQPSGLYAVNLDIRTSTPVN